MSLPSLSLPLCIFRVSISSFRSLPVLLYDDDDDNNNDDDDNSNSYKGLFSNQTHCAVQTFYDKNHVNTYFKPISTFQTFFTFTLLLREIARYCASQLNDSIALTVASKADV